MNFWTFTFFVSLNKLHLELVTFNLVGLQPYHLLDFLLGILYEVLLNFLYLYIIFFFSSAYGELG